VILRNAKDLPGFSRRSQLPMGDACGRRTCLPAVVCEGGAESVKETGRLSDFEKGKRQKAKEKRKTRNQNRKLKTKNYLIYLL